MKPFVIVLLALFAVLQYRLWFGNDGILQSIKMHHQVTLESEKVDTLQKKNDALLSEINSLKKGGEAIENHARNDLGMIKKGEVFYQVLNSSISK